MKNFPTTYYHVLRSYSPHFSHFPKVSPTLRTAFYKLHFYSHFANILAYVIEALAWTLLYHIFLLHSFSTRPNMWDSALSCTCYNATLQAKGQSYKTSWSIMLIMCDLSPQIDLNTPTVAAKSLPAMKSSLIIWNIDPLRTSLEVHTSDDQTSTSNLSDALRNYSSPLITVSCEHVATLRMLQQKVGSWVIM